MEKSYHLLRLLQRMILNQHQQIKMKKITKEKTSKIKKIKDIEVLPKSADNLPFIEEESHLPFKSAIKSSSAKDLVLYDPLQAYLREMRQYPALSAEQEHELATYTKRFTKDDAHLTIDPTTLPTGEEAYQALCRIRAFAGIGDAYFEYKDTRVKIKEAELADDGTLRLLTVTPAGKALLSFTQYLQSLR